MKKTRESTRTVAAAGTLLFGTLLWLVAPVVLAGVIERVSVSVSSQIFGKSDWSSISADGRYVAFYSDANNVVAGDTNEDSDIFVYDRQTGTTERVSVASDGSQSNGPSDRPLISADGRYVAFSSEASNLVADDTNGALDIFVHDRQTGTTERVSVASGNIQGNGDSNSPAISPDGRYVAFESKADNLVASDTNGFGDIFVHDRQTGTTERVSVRSDDSEGNGDSYFPSISADGRYVAFESKANNLVAGDTNGDSDIFVHDRQTGTTERVSVASDSSEGNNSSYYSSLSTDGRYVAFQSYASNLVSVDTNGVLDIFVHDRQTGTTERVSVASDGSQGNGLSYYRPSLSGDGRYIAFASRAGNLVPGDTNGYSDIFVHDRQTGTTERVSVASNGSEGNDDSYRPSLSTDGRYVTFQSYTSNLVSADTNGVSDIFVHDRQTGTTERASVASGFIQGNYGSYRASINGDGRYVAFYSVASNLVGADTNGVSDIFVHDRQTGTTERVSVASGGSESNDDSDFPSISTDGHFVAFESKASTLVAGDTNGVSDIFVHDRQTGMTQRVSVTSNGSEGNNHSYFPSLSGDGRYVAFESIASNLVTGDANGYRDIFVHDRQTGTTKRVSVASDGSEGNGHSYYPSISVDGRYVAFESKANNLVAGDTTGSWDIFVHDRQTGTTQRVSVSSDGSQANGSSGSASLSGDGRYVAFWSSASNLVAGDTNGYRDIFVHDRLTGTTERVSVSSGDSQSNADSHLPSISGDGRYVAFESKADNLVADDTRGYSDIFVYDRQTGTTERLSVTGGGSQSNGDSNSPSISADGRYVAFESIARNLVAGDTNRLTDIFVVSKSGEDIFQDGFE